MRKYLFTGLSFLSLVSCNNVASSPTRLGTQSTKKSHSSQSNKSESILSMLTNRSNQLEIENEEEKESPENKHSNERITSISPTSLNPNDLMDPDKLDNDGLTLLYKSVRDKNMSVFKFALNQSKNPNTLSTVKRKNHKVIDVERITALSRAIFDGSQHFIKFLALNKKVDVNTVQSYSNKSNQTYTNSSITHAIDEKNLLALRLMSANPSFDPNATHTVDERSGLLYCIIADYLPGTNFFANCPGTIINKPDKHGYTSVWTSVNMKRYPHLDLVLNCANSLGIKPLDTNTGFNNIPPLAEGIKNGDKRSVRRLMTRKGTSVKLACKHTKITPTELCIVFQINPLVVPEINFKGCGNYKKLCEAFSCLKGDHIDPKIISLAPEAAHWYFLPREKFELFKQTQTKFIKLEEMALGVMIRLLDKNIDPKILQMFEMQTLVNRIKKEQLINNNNINRMTNNNTNGKFENTKIKS